MKNNLKTNYPLRVRAPYCNTALIKKFPERIVCLSPVNTTTLYCLDALNLLVGHTENDTVPGLSDIPTIGTYTDINIEQVLDDRPDLVLGSDWINENLNRILEQREIPYLAFDPRNVNEVFNYIKLLGKIINKQEKALSLVRALEADDLSFRAKLKKEKRLKHIAERSVFVDLGKFYSAGPGTLLNNELNLIGARNLGATQESNYPFFTPREIINLDPEVYISFVTPIEELRKIEGFDSMSAFKNGLVYFFDETGKQATLIQQPGPTIVEGMKLLAESIYPEIHL